MKPAVIGIAGLPGSGKSTLMNLLADTCWLIDDINKNWSHNIAVAKVKLSENRNLVISDILFCQPRWRRRLEEDLGRSVQWICFENAPQKCEVNARKRNRETLVQEVGYIEWLSKAYVYEPMRVEVEQ